MSKEGFVEVENWKFESEIVSLFTSDSGDVDDAKGDVSGISIEEAKEVLDREIDDDNYRLDEERIEELETLHDLLELCESKVSGAVSPVVCKMGEVLRLICIDSENKRVVIDCREAPIELLEKVSSVCNLVVKD